MKIVIDIPEKVNNRIRSFLGHGYALWDEDVKIIADAIYNGQTEYEAFEWCHDCKEYDQQQHCCHRWTKVIRKTVEELKADNPEIIFCKNCKHWYPDADTGMACEYTNMSQPEDGFCNWAERREE